MHRIKSCQCEDWPCCECADDYVMTAEEAVEMYYCDQCGTSHASVECPWDLIDAEEEELECLDDHGESTCEGDVEYRMALSSTGKSFPRCDKHWSLRLEEQEKINHKYPQHQPADFDPSYAGETWDEDS